MLSGVPERVRRAPTTPELRELAVLDPLLVYSLLTPARRAGLIRPRGDVGDAGVVRPDLLLGWGEPSCGWGWEMFNIQGRFEGGAAEQSVPGQLGGIVEADIWVREVGYIVERPNAFTGSIFKAQSDYFNSLNPSIDFRLTIKSFCQYQIQPDLGPIATLPQKFECVCPIGFVLGCSANISAQFVNKRPLAVDENPTIVTITFHGVRLPTRYDSCAIDKAVDWLQQTGYLPCGTDAR